MPETQLLEEFEAYLQDQVRSNTPSRVSEAMEYSLCAGGKRLRPRLLFAALESYGLDPKTGFPAAAAVEMIHTYSLIHDDLPAMDNDDLRRGRPTCHKAFDEATAILAGDGLLSQAFSTLLQTETQPGILCAMVNTLSTKAGASGMIYGQNLDMVPEERHGSDQEKLRDIDVYKTGQLLQLPLVLAALLAHKPQDVPRWNCIGAWWGLQFQYQDDLLDVLADPDETGKSSSDEENDKLTAVRVFGIDQAQKEIDSLEQKIREQLLAMDIQAGPVLALSDSMKQRTH